MIGLVYIQPFVITIWKLFAIFFLFLSGCNDNLSNSIWTACNWQCSLIYLSIFFSGAKGRSPKFIGSLENVTISQGRDATFTCTVTHLGGHRVSKYVYLLGGRVYILSENNICSWWLLYTLLARWTLDKQCQSAVFQLYLLWFDK